MPRDMIQKKLDLMVDGNPRMQEMLRARREALNRPPSHTAKHEAVDLKQTNVRDFFREELP